ncbi:hypothetical protein DEI99_005300 [Curtobacterium sp. MCLR17_036]|uniref:hypothetical protein n=1 Tax=Curtobacterium sp. MCLR17_036 TaxID=2175620 RepID=UPI000DA95542|nr:hypothetical protein [Curtobacterium sp. MCLR17_036]WIE65956.1 hypothetical protein DEI99_005300 [Curtobacterium sp. MCLR17_036]
MSQTEPTAIRAVTVRAKSRPPIGIDYADGKYILPGRIPPEILTAQAQNKKPRNPDKKVQEQWQQEVGVALVDKFYELVVPEDFKAVLDLEDIDQVFEIWSEHVGLGESKGSEN